MCKQSYACQQPSPSLAGTGGAPAGGAGASSTDASAGAVSAPFGGTAAGGGAVASGAVAGGGGDVASGAASSDAAGGAARASAVASPGPAPAPARAGWLGWFKPAPAHVPLPVPNIASTNVRPPSPAADSQSEIIEELLQANADLQRLLEQAQVALENQRRESARALAAAVEAARAEERVAVLASVARAAEEQAQAEARAAEERRLHGEQQRMDLHMQSPCSVYQHM